MAGNRPLRTKPKSGTPTGGDATVEGIEIENGVFIGGVKARGPGPLSVFCTSFGVGSSAGNVISVGDVNIKLGDVPAGSTLTFGKRTIKGGLKIGAAGDGVSVADANIKPGDVPAGGTFTGGTFTFVKRIIKEGLRIWV